MISISVRISFLQAMATSYLFVFENERCNYYNCRRRTIPSINFRDTKAHAFSPCFFLSYIPPLGLFLHGCLRGICLIVGRRHRFRDNCDNEGTTWLVPPGP